MLNMRSVVTRNRVHYIMVHPQFFIRFIPEVYHFHLLWWGHWRKKADRILKPVGSWAALWPYVRGHSPRDNYLLLTLIKSNSYPFTASRFSHPIKDLGGGGGDILEARRLLLLRIFRIFVSASG